MYKNEINQLRKTIDDDLWALLAENGCMIAGGALTSVFTNKPINDIDVYFPSKQAFTKVVSHLYGADYEGKDRYVTIANGRAVHVTKKALLVNSIGQDVQLIGYAFYNNAQEIFNSFDFTINMAALYMFDERISMHEDFLKHNAQKYLKFNPGTTYPLVSALRVNKYRDRGYTISKSEFLRVMLTVNKKEINSWSALIDELGGMYGTAPEEIFDTTKEFSLDVAIQALDNFEIKDTIISNTPDIDQVVLTMQGSFTDEYIEKRKAYFRTRTWMDSPYEPKPKQAVLLDELEDW